MKKIVDYKLSEGEHAIDAVNFKLEYYLDKQLKRAWRINKRSNKIEKNIEDYLGLDENNKSK